MPTNLLRRRGKSGPRQRESAPQDERIVLLAAGNIQIRIALSSTVTADRIWAALPLHSTVETWGDSIHFEIPVHSGRERSARLNVAAGDVCFWSEDHRVLIGFGPTPISMADEIRLMRPCNIWATALDDVSRLQVVTPGEKVSLTAIT